MHWFRDLRAGVVTAFNCAALKPTTETMVTECKRNGAQFRLAEGRPSSGRRRVARKQVMRRSRELRLSITVRAIEQGTEECPPALLGQHPWSDLPWRLVAHVLAVTAGEFRHPLTILVHAICNNWLLHDRRVQLTSIIQIAHRCQCTLERPSRMLEGSTLWEGRKTVDERFKREETRLFRTPIHAVVVPADGPPTVAMINTQSRQKIVAANDTTEAGAN